MSTVAAQIKAALQQKKAADLAIKAIIRNNRNRIAELGGKIFEIKEQGRLDWWEVEKLDKSIRHVEQHRCAIGFTDSGNISLRFEHFHHECGWIPWDEQCYGIVFRPELLEDSAKFDAFYAKKKAEWDERAEAEKKAALSTKEDELLKELERIRAAQQAA